MRNVSIILFFLSSLFSVCFAQQVKLKDLRVEMQENPEGITTGMPCFMWKLYSNDYDIRQESYNIEMATSEENLKKGHLVWNSRSVMSDNSLFVKYRGYPLPSGKKYFWRVKVKTNKMYTQWSEIQHFSTALLHSSDWKAKWIGINKATNAGDFLGNPKAKVKTITRLAARYLRKEFVVKEKPVRAMLYIGAGGSMENYINGTRISDDVFASLPTHADSTLYFNTYDVTEFINKGNNTLAVKLGNGRFMSMRIPGVRGYGLPRIIAQLNIEYSNGDNEVVVSDESWKATAHGPIIANNEYDGEEYDAQLEMPGWNNVKFDDKKWENADIMDSPKGKLLPQPSPNMKVMEEIEPVSVKALNDSVYILDMGQNMVGWLNVRLKGHKNIPIRMHFAESLNDDGSIFTENLRTAKATDIYIPSRNGSFEWEPSFTYHGFRYVEIRGLDYKPSVKSFIGKVVYDKMRTIGTFETSNDVINKVYKNAYWGIRGNYRGMPTDCPQRDERLGWLGDRTTGAYGESFIFENALLYKKWLQDIKDSRNEEGYISDVSPRAWSVYNKNVTWPAAYFYTANMIYRQFGDIREIVKHYQAMRQWMLLAHNSFMKDSVVAYDKYGDWCMPPEDPKLIHSKDPARQTAPAILSSSMYYSLLNMMTDFAKIVKRKTDAAEYMEWAKELKQAFNNRFFNKQTAQYDNNTVTANILPLCLGLAPKEYESSIFKNIVNKTEKEFDSHVSTGVIGIQHLMRGLTKYGRADLAYTIASNDTYPSWGYMVRKGATTIWELWNGDTGAPDMNSANHVMLLGDLIIWYYENILGIANYPSSAGFKKILMHPTFIHGLEYANGSYDSVMGLIKSRWERKDKNIVWNIEIPANSTAHIILDNVKKAYISGGDLSENMNVTNGQVVKDIGSGRYKIQLEEIAEK